MTTFLEFNEVESQLFDVHCQTQSGTIAVYAESPNHASMAFKFTQSPHRR
jgi:hypothetical protein